MGEEDHMKGKVRIVIEIQRELGKCGVMESKEKERAAVLNGTEWSVK